MTEDDRSENEILFLEHAGTPKAQEGPALQIHCGDCKADITGACYIAIVPGPQGPQPLIFQPGRCPECKAYTVHQVASPRVVTPIRPGILRPDFRGPS